MKNLLFSILIFGIILTCVSLILKSIYLLGIAEIIIIPTMVMLYRINLKKL